MGSVTFGVPEELAQKLRDAYGLQWFIETGTYRANTTQWAGANFANVVTIEAYPPYHERATRVLAHLPNVQAVLGNSGEMLAKILPAASAVVWLDAHWMGNMEASFENGMECPILAEIDALNATEMPHYILIDDARLFIDGPERTAHPEQWPGYDVLLRHLHAGKYPRAVFVYEDVIIAVPLYAAPLVKAHMGKGEMTVAVLTSNGYVGCLPGFAYLFNRYWDSRQAVKVVRYDRRPPALPANFSNFAIGRQSDYTWSSGLLRWLPYVNDSHLILFLEDYYLDKAVDVARVRELWNYAYTHPGVAKIDLTDDRLKVGRVDYGDDLVLSDENAPFQTSLQAAIWRVDFLTRFLHPSENPWQFEKKGTTRVRAARRAGKFDGLILGCTEPPLHYVNAVGGEGNKPGEFDRRKFPPELWRELAAKGLVQ